LIQKNSNPLPLIQVSDITGKVLKQIKLQSVNEKIDISDLQNGVYFIGSINKNQFKPQKFVKISE